jgi:integrase
MLTTRDLGLDDVWGDLLTSADRRIRLRLSRFARWASQNRIAPEAVNAATIDHFIADLNSATLVRNLKHLPRNVAKGWNALVALHEAAGLQPVAIPGNGRALIRIPWRQLPPSFQQNVERYTTWASMPDPLDEGARARALSPRTLRLQQAHIHSAVTAAAAASIPLEQLTSLACLVELETFRALLRHRWREDGGKLSAYTHGLAVTLIAIASEWVKAPADTITALKALRGKLGSLPSGFTDKNQALLRTFDDPRLLAALVELPDRLWNAARRGLAASQSPFTDLQSALAIDLLLHVPLRMHNLAALNFERHLHWPQGPRKPALLTFASDETKNDVRLEFEIPTALADRLLAYRNEIAPAVIGVRPNALFVTRTGRPRSQAAIMVAIEKTVLRHLGVKLTPHQFRHLAAKIVLDANPGRLRAGPAVVGPHEPENHYVVLRWRQHAKGRASSCRARYEAARIQVEPSAPPP